MYVETAMAFAILTLCTLIGTGVIEVPSDILLSPLTQAVLLIITLSVFVVSPMAGTGLIVLFVVLMVKRQNVIDAQKAAEAAAVPDVNAVAIQQYNDTAAERKAVELATQAADGKQHTENFGDAGASASAEVMGVPEPAEKEDIVVLSAVSEEGQYPLEEPRPLADIPETQTVTAPYKPSEDMGENAFERSGPELDEKMRSFAY